MIYSATVDTYMYVSFVEQGPTQTQWNLSFGGRGKGLTRLSWNLN
jgi:hypothetical protein